MFFKYGNWTRLLNPFFKTGFRSYQGKYNAKKDFYYINRLAVTII